VAALGLAQYGAKGPAAEADPRLDVTDHSHLRTLAGCTESPSKDTDAAGSSSTSKAPSLSAPNEPVPARRWSLPSRRTARDRH
jgi:hypothetical protein